MTALERLSEWLRRSRLNQTEAAKELGIHKTHLNQILKGRRNPGLENALKLQRLAGIPAEDWVPTRGAQSGDSKSETVDIIK